MEAVEAALVPPPFVAVAVNVYGVPFVRPLTVQEPDLGVPLSELTVHWRLSGFEVTVNDEGVPPVPPSVTVTTTEAFCADPVGCAGAEGAAGCGVVEPEALDELLVPDVFVAFAVNV